MSAMGQEEQAYAALQHLVEHEHQALERDLEEQHQHFATKRERAIVGRDPPESGGSPTQEQRHQATAGASAREGNRVSATTRLSEQETLANTDKLRLENKVAYLERQLSEQNTLLEQERAQLPQQSSRRKSVHDDIRSLLESAMPHFRRLMEAYERNHGQAESSSEPVDLTADTPAIQTTTRVKT
ncbi:hypothetical protein ON010_g2975 [Phytophthora cinnamomi]|nr:hypothetical protein ON010_g2975 [Phytophthora cinnamomi]